MPLINEVSNSNSSSELDSTIDTKLAVSVYEPVNSDGRWPVELGRECLICLETCSEQRPMWRAGHCRHGICKLCFIKLLSEQKQPGQWALCPFCRASLDLRIRWSLPPPCKFTVSYDHWDGHYFRKLPQDRYLAGKNEDGDRVVIENTSYLEIRQLGDFTEIHLKRTMGLKVTSCIHNHSVNCKQSEAISQSKRISQILDLLASEFKRETDISRSKDRISFCVAKEIQPGDEPLFVETLLQKSTSRLDGDCQELESIPCGSKSGIRSYEFILWNTKIRERSYPHALIPPSCLPPEDKLTRKRIFRTFVDIHKVLALRFPEIQQATDVVPFLESKGLRMSNTRLALHPGKEFSDVVTRSSVISTVAEAIQERLGRPTALRLDEDDRPFEDARREYISPWYNELEELYRANFEFAKD
ncbi:RING/U-box [Glarea lozoyensis ATCC 20868]|uniref:RING/U-box n=1 Tax=Glarea lozoyensis (strain ATCC 20868 / MF5171) TaxID=1116229 RepID=S3CPS0_GLAL2|nr:RING/U-box [Glarea lozoyensis ATCC 20868]EPE28477.1 RING/U-box [Glarea lozoyensis ATCC 20868]